MPAPVATDESSDRRIAPRRQPAMGTVCRLDADDGPSRIALVWNISVTGVSVLSPDPRPTGTVLTGYLEQTEGDTMLRVSMRVVHAKRLDTGDYFLGAHFDRRLTEDEMKPFIAES